MSRHPFNQPLRNSRGFSVPELLIALLMMAIAAGVIGGLFKAGIKSFLYATNQIAAFASARRAMDTGNPSPGMVWQARRALATTGLSTTQLILNLPGGATAQYALSGQALQLTQTSSTTLATNISNLQVGYYNLDSAGHIMISTMAASASFITISIQTQPSVGAPYTFLEGVSVRNHP